MDIAETVMGLKDLTKDEYYKEGGGEKFFRQMLRRYTRICQDDGFYSATADTNRTTYENNIQNAKKEFPRIKMYMMNDMIKIIEFAKGVLQYWWLILENPDQLGEYVEDLTDYSYNTFYSNKNNKFLISMYPKMTEWIKTFLQKDIEEAHLMVKKPVAFIQLMGQLNLFLVNLFLFGTTLSGYKTTDFSALNAYPYLNSAINFMKAGKNAGKNASLACGNALQNMLDNFLGMEVGDIRYHRLTMRQSIQGIGKLMLTDFAKTKRGIAVNVAGDGSCFYQALYYWLLIFGQLGDVHTLRDLKQEILDRAFYANGNLKPAIKMILPLVHEMKKHELEQEINLENRNEFANELPMKLSALAFGIQIVIYSATGRKAKLGFCCPGDLREIEAKEENNVFHFLHGMPIAVFIHTGNGNLSGHFYMLGMNTEAGKEIPKTIEFDFFEDQRMLPILEARMASNLVCAE